MMTIKVNGLPYKVHSYVRLPPPEVDVERHNPGEVDTRPAWFFLAIGKNNDYFRIVIRVPPKCILDASDDVPVEVQTSNATARFENAVRTYGAVIPPIEKPYLQLASGRYFQDLRDVSVSVRRATREEVWDIESTQLHTDDVTQIIECDYKEFRRVRWKWQGVEYKVQLRGRHLSLMLKKLYHAPSRTLTSARLNAQMHNKVQWNKLIREQAPELLDGHLILHETGSKTWTLNIA